MTTQKFIEIETKDGKVILNTNEIVSIEHLSYGSNVKTTAKDINGQSIEYITKETIFKSKLKDN